MDTNKVATGLKVFGAVLFTVCLVLIIWSLFRPAVTTGPMPDQFGVHSTVDGSVHDASVR